MRFSLKELFRDTSPQFFVLKTGLLAEKTAELCYALGIWFTPSSAQASSERKILL